MKIKAYKYQGAGNDFVIIDNRNGKVELTEQQVKLLCDRRFGIGSDGLMLLGNANSYNFSMRYFNSDGKEGTMCGNGGRCLVAFAGFCGIKEFHFTAIDGQHTAYVLSQDGNRDIVKLKMIDVPGFKPYSENAYYLNTGSPHYVEFVTGLNNYPVDEKGKYWRYHKDFKGGTNVNFVEFNGNDSENGNSFNNNISVRTYERGVEAETYACGTGITASSLATFMHFNRPVAAERNNGIIPDKISIHCNVQAVGDKLCVDAQWYEKENTFKDIWLTGPATQVFYTEIEIL